MSSTISTHSLEKQLSEISQFSLLSSADQSLATEASIFDESEPQTEQKQTEIYEYKASYAMDEILKVDETVSISQPELPLGQASESLQMKNLNIADQTSIKVEEDTEKFDDTLKIAKQSLVQLADDSRTTAHEDVVSGKTSKQKYIRQSSDTRNDVLEDEILPSIETAQDKVNVLTENTRHLKEQTQQAEDVNAASKITIENVAAKTMEMDIPSVSTTSHKAIAGTLDMTSEISQKEVKFDSSADEKVLTPSNLKSIDHFYAQNEEVTEQIAEQHLHMESATTSLQEEAGRTIERDASPAFLKSDMMKNINNTQVDNSVSSESSVYSSLESRPLSSDVDNLLPRSDFDKAFSSEYQTAVDKSCFFESTEYESAVSLFDTLSSKTISSNDSIKSLPSQSETSAELCTIDASDTSETIIASLIEDDIDDEIEELEDTTAQEQSDPIDVPTNYMPVTMKRSKEMIFKDSEEMDDMQEREMHSTSINITPAQSTKQIEQYAATFVENLQENISDITKESGSYKSMELFAQDQRESYETKKKVQTQTSEEIREQKSKTQIDCYESEYVSQFSHPNSRSTKKKKYATEIDYTFDADKKSFTPSQLVAEVIVEDTTTEELEAEKLKRVLSTTMKTPPTSIPNITVTEENQETPETTEDADIIEPPVVAVVDKTIEMTQAVDAAKTPSSSNEEQFKKLVQEQYKQKLAEITALDKELSSSKDLDTFEVIDKPDMLDDFVMIEEVAKEANETNLGQQSMNINPATNKKEFDTEVEKILVKSAPADPKLGSLLYKDDFNLEFEESPPQNAQTYGETSFNEEAELPAANKRWVEMQLQDSKYPYPYDISSGILEDIKEEDSEVDVTSSRISSFKESFSSTPEYSRRCINRCDQDNISMSSLQEFESLEKAISLENRTKTVQGSTGSSNGSFTRRYKMSHRSEDNGKGDDVSNSSLKDFEGLETACLEAHLIEIKAKHEASLLSHSDESNKSYATESKPQSKTGTDTDADQNTSSQPLKTEDAPAEKAKDQNLEN